MIRYALLAGVVTPGRHDELFGTWTGLRRTINDARNYLCIAQTIVIRETRHVLDTVCSNGDFRVTSRLQDVFSQHLDNQAEHHARGKAKNKEAEMGDECVLLVKWEPSS